MGKMGSFDYKDLKKLSEQVKKATSPQMIDKWIEELLLELAYRAEAKIKPRTPVDTGDLRRRWKVGKVQRANGAYIVEITNNLDYASYVEYGHRSGNSGGWVEGRFMATISMKEIEREMPGYLEKKQEEFLNKIMGV